MASTAWSINLRIMTSSTAPSILGKIATAAREAQKQVGSLSKELGQVPKSMDGIDTAAQRTARVFATLKTNGVSSFGQVRTAVKSLAQQFDTTANASRVAMDKVDTSLRGVRLSAGSAAAAVSQIANAARRLPASFRVPNVLGAIGGGGGVGRGGYGSGGSGGGGGGAHGGGSGWADTGTLGLAAVGALSGGALISGVRGAGDLQQQEAQLAVSGLPQSRMAEFHRVAMMMSQQTAQSVADSMNMLRVMAVSGVPIDKLHGSALENFAMAAARYADINYLATGHKHAEFEDSANLLAGLSHDLQIYDPTRMAKFADTLYRAGYQSGSSPSQMMTQMRQYAPRFKAAGVSDEDIVNLYPLIDRFGLGKGRGGTGLNMIMKNLQDPRGKTKQRALEEMGIYDASGQNRFIDQATGNVNFMGPNGFIQYVAKWRDQMRLSQKGALANLLESRGFDTNAANVLEVMATTGGMHQLTNIRSRESNMTDLQTAQARLMSGFNSQEKLLSSNFKTLMTEIVTPLMPPLTKLIHNLAELTGKLSLFFHDHPGAGKAAAIGLGGLAAAGTIASLAIGGYIAHGAISSLIGHMGGYRVASALGQGGAMLVRGGATVGGIAAAGGALAASRGVLGRVLGGAGRFLGAGAFGSAKGLFGDIIKELAGVRIAAIVGGRGFLMSRVGLMGIAEIAVKLGLRAIPVVGEVLMLVDTIRFLGDHAKDIGKGIGIAAGWIVAHGVPMIVGAFVKLMNAIWNAVSHPGNAIGGLWNWGVNAVKGLGAGISEGYASQTRPQKMATGGFTRGEGLAYLHRNEIVVNDPLTKRLDRMTRRAASGSGGVVINFSPVYHAAPGESDMTHARRAKKMAKEMANQVAAILADQLGLDIHAGGAIPQLAGHSHFAIVGARVAS